MQSKPAFDRDRAKLAHFHHLSKHALPPASHSQTLPQSFIPPNAYWTPAEKEAFFNSLRTRSRWRPDLIAADLGGAKSVADVCVYIVLLERGARDADADQVVRRDAMPCAREVSEEWVQAEESIADMVAAEDRGEGVWYKAFVKRKRKEACKAAVQALEEEEGTAELLEERRKKIRKALKEVWKREDVLASLDGRYLKAMESMVRHEDEDGDGAREQEQEQMQAGPSSNVANATVPHTPPPQTLNPPRSLSPASKRRIRKRLWMRRKRALQSGLSPSSSAAAAAASTDPWRKLKPGRKGKEKERSADVDVEDTEHAKKKRRLPGWTKLESVGIDGAFLHAAGVDLFRLGNFAGFGSLLNDVHDPFTHGPAMSYGVLLLLRAHVVRFLTRLIGRIIVHKEVARGQKEGIKSRSQAGALKVRSKNVHEALDVMGYPRTREQFFRRLKKRKRDEVESLPGDSDASTPTSDSDPDPDSGMESSTSSHDLDSGNTTLLPPVPPPFSSETPPFWQWFGAPRGDDDETLLPEDLDEEALLRELEVEDALDAHDELVECEMEDALWEEIGVPRGVVDGSEGEGEGEAGEHGGEGEKVRLTAAHEERRGKPLRFREPEPGGAVKSRVYLSDSDDIL